MGIVRLSFRGIGAHSAIIAEKLPKIKIFGATSLIVNITKINEIVNPAILPLKVF